MDLQVELLERPPAVLLQDLRQEKYLDHRVRQEAQQGVVRRLVQVGRLEGLQVVVARQVKQEEQVAQQLALLGHREELVVQQALWVALLVRAPEAHQDLLLVEGIRQVVVCLLVQVGRSVGQWGAVARQLKQEV